MKLVTIGAPMGTPDDHPVFRGEVLLQEAVGEADAELFRSFIVTFRPGGRTVWHHHECDQLLVITHGHGIIASEDEELRVRGGDMVLIPAGTKHWHGSDGDSEMCHVSVMTPGAEILHEEVQYEQS